MLPFMRLFQSVSITMNVQVTRPHYMNLYENFTGANEITEHTELILSHEQHHYGIYSL